MFYHNPAPFSLIKEVKDMNQPSVEKKSGTVLILVPIVPIFQNPVPTNQTYTCLRLEGRSEGVDRGLPGGSVGFTPPNPQPTPSQPPANPL